MRKKIINENNKYYREKEKDKLTNKNNYSSALTITRCIFDELTRIFNHMLAISCHALDVGSMSTIF